MAIRTHLTGEKSFSQRGFFGEKMHSLNGDPLALSKKWSGEKNNTALARIWKKNSEYTL